MNKVLGLYNKLEKIPAGKWVFSKLACFNAPYFGSVKPLYEELKPGFCVISMKKRRAVLNHIKSVHAIAMCNLSELAAGTMLEVSIPPHMRWIPKKMSVEYLKVAKTDLKAACEMPEVDWAQNQDLPLTVNVKDKNSEIVFRAVITMYVSHKRK